MNNSTVFEMSRLKNFPKRESTAFDLFLRPFDQMQHLAF